MLLDRPPDSSEVCLWWPCCTWRGSAVVEVGGGVVGVCEGLIDPGKVPGDGVDPGRRGEVGLREHELGFAGGERRFRQPALDLGELQFGGRVVEQVA